MGFRRGFCSDAGTAHAVQAVVVDRNHSDDIAGSWRMHHLTVADVHRDVVNRFLVLRVIGVHQEVTQVPSRRH